MIITQTFRAIQRWFSIRNCAGQLILASLFLISFGIVSTGASHISEAAQSQQHDWVGDVPIMPKLSLEPALGFAFDSPNGRIVMIFASSLASKSDVIGFYNASLPAIGWVGADGIWRRDTETLLISEVDTVAGKLWRLMVRPH